MLKSKSRHPFNTLTSRISIEQQTDWYKNQIKVLRNKGPPTRVDVFVYSPPEKLKIILSIQRPGPDIPWIISLRNAPASMHTNSHFSSDITVSPLSRCLRTSSPYKLTLRFPEYVIFFNYSSRDFVSEYQNGLFRSFVIGDCFCSVKKVSNIRISGFKSWYCKLILLYMTEGNFKEIQQNHFTLFIWYSMQCYNMTM